MNKRVEDLYDKWQESSGVSIDTRTIGPGDMFFALKGPSFDGNQYAAKALAQGASYAVVDDPKVIVDDRYLLITDVLEALQELSAYHRDKLEIPVIALTGSNGKTTTKELIKAVLSKRFVVSATKGNLNNHIGVPLTLLNCDPDAEILIVEMGTNQPGDIAPLCHMAKPTHGLITNIGASHLEKLINEDGVFEEKGELFRYIERYDGVFFQNIGDKYLIKLTPSNGVPYSKDDCPLGVLTKVKTAHPYLTLQIDLAGEKRVIQTLLAGDFNQENVSTALSVGGYFGLTMPTMIEAIKGYQPDNMRSQVIQTERHTIILDAYNANPSSMKASILHHRQVYGPDSHFIIGDMLELGEESRGYHQEILQLLADQGCANVICIGSTFGKMPQTLFAHFDHVSDCLASGILKQWSGCNILIKGSRGIQLEKVLAQL